MESFLNEIEEIYDWVDQEVAKESPRCEISGRCCKFREYGHRLYISEIEAKILSEKPLPEISTGTDTISFESVLEKCPYQVNGLCTARENRPLGCRIYFCDPAYDQKGEEITEEAIRRLKNVHKKYDKPWIYNDLAYWLSEGNDQNH